MLIRFVAFVAACIAVPGCAGAKPVYPARVIIIRHAEKPDDENARDLSATGKRRAEALAELFQKSDTRPDPLPTPDFIFATKASKRSDRPVETVAPLAKKLKLDIDSRYANDDYAKLATEMLSNPKYEGKTVLICWHHGNIPELAGSLKVGDVPDKWKDSVFDRAWVVTYEGGKGRLTKRPQTLLPGDAEK
ncbi:histidine phosphatase family protein [Gemmata sp. G18]|uniref:Histidine phosphatase family protein n=1 Tax=Gemmata palustris TaxID=2822762 RepID=A0ABS5BPV1_9BACT|nr:histidine phosphatase family protein [Gemmata palustris]MBP3955769.1 histidine phosphatase family protein [Gemmata palustris]